MPGPERSYSFNYHDEQTFHSNGQHGQHSQQYNDSQPPASTPLLDDSPDDPPAPPIHRVHHPGMHPGSNFSELQSHRQYGNTNPQQQQQPPSLNTGVSAANVNIPRRPVSQSPPTSPSRSFTDQAYNAPRDRRGSFTTPGMDNLGQKAVGGGIAGIAMGVADTHERESGVQAMRAMENWGRPGQNGIPGSGNSPPERQPSQFQYGSPNGPYDPYMGEHRPYMQNQPSTNSVDPLTTAAYTPGMSTPYENMPPAHHFPTDNAYPYMEDPYSNRFSVSHSRLNTALAPIDPRDIEDDGDDGITPPPGQKRKSFLGIGGRSPSDHNVSAGAAGAAGAGAAIGAVAAAGASSGVLSKSSPDANGYYGSVPGGGSSSLVGSDNVPEKSEWLSKEASGNKRLKWIVGIIIGLVVIGAIVGGVVGGILTRKGSSNNSGSSGSSSSGSSSSSTPGSVADDNKTDLNKDSSEIKALLGNKNLHKVFPGMDYTPMNAQYPDCMQVPPSQNNVTRDMAIFSQLTNAVRLYGTDCNQTEMVLHSIQQLGLTDMKVWLGVYLDNNATTNARQLAHMWTLLDTYGADPFKGVIVGNEVLFRQDLTATELGSILAEVKTNMTNKKIDLPVASSDLGDNWTATLATSVDIVMANIHPFFAGVTAEEAAGWTWDFWQGHDVVVTKGMTDKSHVISEVGWPSGGGNRCGVGNPCTSKTDGSVAGIPEMNTFMSNWVCQSLANGTEYFWFEAIDEPWKVRFNTATEQWEDKWGLLDVNRKLKPGVEIPDCGGQTI